jgi:lipopolysaccharide/colanic/teichoic acid biosynthesis glycosyltransferase
MINQKMQADALTAEFDWNPAQSPELAPQLSLVPSDTRLDRWQYRIVKRMIDILGSALGIALFLVPGILIAAAIAVSSRGPIFYREARIGRGGRVFYIWKFRSMHADPHRCSHGDTARHFDVLARLRTCKDMTDPRITYVGGFLRQWSLDEFPQLFNVFLGEMSLIGPRPVVHSELRLYSHLVGFYLAATPGMSGLWQVSGRSDVSFPNRARLDAAYVRKWSLMMDFVILSRTIPAVLQRVGAR